MPLPKILAPFLPRHQHHLQKSKDSRVLSPALPLSPPSNNRLTVNHNGDTIIGLATVDEDASAKSDETIMEESDSDKSPTSNSESAMVLHEKPTAFELCDNDLIIESVKEFQDDNGNFDKNMMRDNTAYQSTTTTFAPPTGYFGEEITQSATLINVTEKIQPAMVALRPSPPVTTMEKEQKPAEFEFIKPIQAEFIQEVFASPKFEEKQEQKQSHLAMEATFKRAKENSDFKSKCKKMFNDLVCKPEVSEYMNRMKPTPAKHDNEPTPAKHDNEPTPAKHDNEPTPAKHDNEPTPAKHDNEPTPAKHDNEPTPAGRGGLEYVDTKFVSAFDRQEKEEEDKDMNTPIYRHRNTSSNSLYQLNNADSIAPYKSPVLGTDAYDIKLLCDQSFFGRW